jgi:ATP-dependent exoDNAse (exonuclease V) alpha subunit
VAIYHCKLQVINRKAGPGIVASAAYRAGERIRDEKSGKTHDYQRRAGIVYSEIIPPMMAPNWVFNRAKLWNTVESTEKRKDAQLAREIMVALPKELNLEQRIKLVRGYIFQQFVRKGMIADFAIHAPSKKGDDRNYHAHILLTMRTITSAGFGGKVREWNAKSYIYQWRQAWENHTNQALEQAGVDCRVDCRSHASKGLDREPRLHLGYQAMAIERRGEQSERGNENRAIEARNETRAKLRSEQTKVSDEWEHQHHNHASRQPQAISSINDIDCSESDIPDAHYGKSLDTTKKPDSLVGGT